MLPIRLAHLIYTHQVNPVNLQRPVFPPTSLPAQLSLAWGSVYPLLEYWQTLCAYKYKGDIFRKSGRAGGFIGFNGSLSPHSYSNEGHVYLKKGQEQKLINGFV